MDGYYLGTSPDHYRSHRICGKETNVERVSENVFFKHKYLTNPTVTHADKVVQAAKELYNALNRKRHGMEKATMEGLKELSSMYLKMAKQSNTIIWEEEACQESNNPPKLTFSKEVTVIPANNDQQGPKRAIKEFANLESNKIMSKDGPPARNTRSRFAAAAAALAAIASVT